jgi:hypothetical protein
MTQVGRFREAILTHARHLNVMGSVARAVSGSSVRRNAAAWNDPVGEIEYSNARLAIRSIFESESLDSASP